MLQRYLTLHRLDFDDDVAATAGASGVGQTLSPASLTLKDATEAFECQFIRHCLHQNQGHKGHTAAILNVDLKTLYRKMKNYHID